MIFMNNKFRNVLFFLFCIGVIIDVFYMSSLPMSYSSDLRIFFLLAVWLFVEKIWKFGSVATFKVALVFLVVLFFLFTFFRTQPSVERVATWIYLLLLIGIIQQFLEIRKEKTK